MDKVEWLTDIIYRESGKFYFRTPYEDTEGPYDTFELAEKAMNAFCDELLGDGNSIRCSECLFSGNKSSEPPCITCSRKELKN